MTINGSKISRTKRRSGMGEVLLRKEIGDVDTKGASHPHKMKSRTISDSAFDPALYVAAPNLRPVGKGVAVNR